MPTEEPIAFEAFGVPVSLAVPSPELRERVQGILPPGALPAGSVPDDHRFALISKSGTSFAVASPGNVLSGSSDVDVALEVLDSQLRGFIALKAPERVFVHAGVAAREGRAVVIPGSAFSGKTSLVSELVRCGWSYYSDDFAVLDRDGLVHPYPKPLSIRIHSPRQVNHHVSAFGGSTGTDPVPIGLILDTHYLPGSTWDPEPLSSGDALLALLNHTIPVHEDPERALITLRRAIENALALRGPRGEATEVVEQLFEALPA